MYLNLHNVLHLFIRIFWATFLISELLLFTLKIWQNEFPTLPHCCITLCSHRQSGIWHTVSSLLSHALWWSLSTLKQFLPVSDQLKIVKTFPHYAVGMLIAPVIHYNTMREENLYCNVKKYDDIYWNNVCISAFIQVQFGKSTFFFFFS